VFIPTIKNPSLKLLVQNNSRKSCEFLIFHLYGQIEEKKKKFKYDLPLLYNFSGKNI